MGIQRITRRWSLSFGVLMVALAMMLIASPVASAHHQISFSGSAFGAGIFPRFGSTTFADTGSLPASGGTRRASLAQASAPDLFTAHALRAIIVGKGNGSRAVASLEHLVVTDGINTITADVVEARAEAKCVSGRAVIAGHSRVTHLTLNGHAINVTGKPNQIVIVTSVGSGESLIINAQSTGAGVITVTGLTFIQTDLQSVLFASATADVSHCPPRR